MKKAAPRVLRAVLPCGVLLWCAAFAAAVPFGVPAGAQRVIKTSSPVYDALAALALDSGRLPFAVNGPATAGELRRYLDAIPYESLSSVGRYDYALVLQELSRPVSGISWDGFISLGTEAAVSIDGYVKSNAAIGWQYEWKNRDPFFLLPLVVSAGDYLTLETSASVGIYEGAALRHFNFTNIPLRMDTLDGNFPHDAYASVGFQHDGRHFLNFQIGRGSLNIGRTAMGSIIISDYMRDVSYAKISLFSPRLRFSSYVTQHAVNKYFYFHHFEVRPADWFSVSMLEGVMVNAPLELRYLNPMMIFHGFGAWRDYDAYNADMGNGSHPAGDSRVGSYLAFTVDARPCAYTRLYGLFAMNQFQLKFEIENDPAALAVPNSLGFQGGVESIVPLKSGYLTVNGEFVYTMPWFYVSRDKEWSLVSERTEFYRGGSPLLSWIGSPFGPDTIACQIGASYGEYGDWKAGVRYRFTVHGENGKNVFEKDHYYPTTVEEAQASTPTGTPEYSHAVMLSGEKTLFPGISVQTGCGVSHYLNKDNVRGNTQTGFEASVSLRIRPYEAYRTDGVQ
ncbi:hypothetical protein Trebr_2433 [Treponema brennaborense DSM 12168]|uniref:Capsule assembly Wzi family protein n=2 Tax=Treponema TaxID=157 RepID=F4LMV0_TREBD|nr:hypothetical protein Trebr_2433 [Treponema brennaborense DSM 12168]